MATPPLPVTTRLPIDRALDCTPRPSRPVSFSTAMIENVLSAGAYCRVGVSSAVAAVSANPEDRKSTRLNSSHSQISYAVFCLKKKKKKNTTKKHTTQHRTRRGHKRSP